MVRSHIGNVVCRKALSVRVASSPPFKSRNEILFLSNVVLFLDFSVSSEINKTRRI